MSDVTHLDTSGLLCPLPVIRTQDAVAHLAPGSRLTILATDPGTLHDIPAWARVHGHKIVAAESADDLFHFEIEVQ